MRFRLSRNWWEILLETPITSLLTSLYKNNGNVCYNLIVTRQGNSNNAGTRAFGLCLPSPFPMGAKGRQVVTRFAHYRNPLHAERFLILRQTSKIQHFLDISFLI